MDLDGLPVTLLDMAGLRASDDEVERLGIARALDRAGKADMRVFLVSDYDEAARLGVPQVPGDVVVLAKADLRPAGDGLAVSGVTGAGVAELLDRIARDLQVRTAGAATASHARQIEAIGRAAAAVERSLELLRAPGDRFELAAAEIARRIAGA